jgi:hypothetical protein
MNSQVSLRGLHGLLLHRAAWLLWIILILFILDLQPYDADAGVLKHPKLESFQSVQRVEHRSSLSFNELEAGEGPNVDQVTN